MRLCHGFPERQRLSRCKLDLSCQGLSTTPALPLDERAVQLHWLK
jgi:hypothetical protein